MTDQHADAEARYARAVALVDQIRAQWEEMGAPLTTEGGATGRATVTHPLVKLLQEAERDADRFLRAITKRHAGPRPSAVMQADLGVSPAAKLRSVG